MRSTLKRWASLAVGITSLAAFWLATGFFLSFFYVKLSSMPFFFGRIIIFFFGLLLNPKSFSLLLFNFYTFPSTWFYYKINVHRLSQESYDLGNQYHVSKIFPFPFNVFFPNGTYLIYLTCGLFTLSVGSTGIQVILCVLVERMWNQQWL